MFEILFCAALHQDDKNGEPMCSPFKRLLVKQYTFILSPQSLCDSSSSTKRSTKSLCFGFDVLFGPLNITRFILAPHRFAELTLDYKQGEQL